MRGSRLRKPNTQSFLNPSWILPSNDGQENLAILESSASETTSVNPTSNQPGEHVSPQDTAPPDQPADMAEKPTPVNGKRKARYARQHSSKWLEHDAVAEVTTSLDKAEQPQPQQAAAARIASSTKTPPASIFRQMNWPRRSPGYDAPAISPPVSSTYSPSYGQ
ncbi:hypothetical protein N7462_000400 [Penicillium macrosclerotiorum]|uniref:uncharacterized protein n=1 Tax=Penicillium macrosclerotiorum TaxID=303699 RepID=UPI002546AFDA|nr:uncharacterized protein N7462_000400 [Penicillium macrosclerotiorum]KAJ5698395.1 hypothetical protein N7462_000400 [Penicillium macrosclerotiorum]